MLVFQNILYLNLLWFIIPLVLLMFYSRKKKEQALSLFTGGMKSNENTFQMTGYKIASWLMILSIIFLIVAIGRPAWNKETRIIEKKGHDVVYLIDVSRSMMADDLIPNRLERAKLAVIDSVNSLDGDRVALVAFAGSAVVKTPLTNDYSFFVTAVESLRIESVSKGGSLIGDALRYAIDNVLDESSKAGKDIILITDGEDQDSFPIEAAREADQQGIRIITIGLGNENEGRRIPVQTENGKEFLTFNGEEIWTKLDAQVLRDIAGATEGGQYLNVSTGTFDLAEIYKTLKGRHQEVEYEEDEVTVYEERFQLFLFFSILFAFLSFFQPFRGFKYLIHRDDLNKMKRIVTRK